MSVTETEVTEVTESEVLPEGFSQEAWDELKEAIMALDDFTAFEVLLTLAMTGFAGPLAGPDDVETIQHALVEAARFSPSEVAAAGIVALLS